MFDSRSREILPRHTTVFPSACRDLESLELEVSPEMLLLFRLCVFRASFFGKNAGRIRVVTEEARSNPIIVTNREEGATCALLNAGVKRLGTGMDAVHRLGELAGGRLIVTVDGYGIHKVETCPETVFERFYQLGFTGTSGEIRDLLSTCWRHARKYRVGTGMCGRIPMSQVAQRTKYAWPWFCRRGLENFHKLSVVFNGDGDICVQSAYHATLDHGAEIVLNGSGTAQ
jgi:hypothetical protein